MVRGENKIQACDASLLGQAGAQHSLSPLICRYGAVMIRAYSRPVPGVCAKVNLAGIRPPLKIRPQRVKQSSTHARIPLAIPAVAGNDRHMTARDSRTHRRAC
jgi:hypothetical protein